MGKPAVAIGIRPHTGWAVAVVVGGTARAPQVLHRERVELVPDGVERFAYHLVQDWPLAEAAASVEATQLAVEATAAEVLADLCNRARGLGRLAGIGLVGEPHDVPELERVLASHTLLHTAEGELFFGSLVDAAAQQRVGVTLVPPKATLDSAAHALGTDPERFTKRLADLRAELGAPWQADHKAATAAALVALES
jgi:hypothetical protein